MFKVLRSVVSIRAGNVLEALGFLQFYKVKPSVGSAFSYRLMSSTGSHITEDWPLQEKAQENAWARKQEAANKEALHAELTSKVLQVPKDLLHLVEMELEDVLCNEYITPSAKSRLMDWKLKVWECVSHVHRTPSEQAFAVQQKQVAAMGELDALLHSNGLDLGLELSDAIKHKLVDWKLKAM